MFNTQPLLPWLYIILLIHTFGVSRGDFGTAAFYSPPYTPTACGGKTASLFPSSNLFAAVGEKLWDNGAACGREYLVKCKNGVVPRTCIPGHMIRVRIVDLAETLASRPSKNGTTMVLSRTAFAAISNGFPASIDIEFRR